MRYIIWHIAIHNMRYGGQLCSLLKSTLFFMRDGNKNRGRRHPVVMHKQKRYQRLCFGLLIKVIAASTSCKKMFPAPRFYCTGNLSGLLSRKTLPEEQNQKAKSLREVEDVTPRVHSLLPQHIGCHRCPTTGRDGAGSASHRVTARSRPWIIFNRYFKGLQFR